MMSSVTPNTPRAEPEVPGTPSPPLGVRRAPGGFWSFLRTLFVGTAGLAVLAVAGALAGSAWLTANQRAEAEKPQPWANPSFTTTAVTTGGLLARWMDNDGDLDNGHTYIKGIYDLWKSGVGANAWADLTRSPSAQLRLPQLWQAELKNDLANAASLAALNRQTTLQRSYDLEAQLNLGVQRSMQIGGILDMYNITGTVSVPDVVEYVGLAAEPPLKPVTLTGLSQVLRAFVKPRDTGLCIRPPLLGEFADSDELKTYATTLDPSERSSFLSALDTVRTKLSGYKAKNSLPRDTC